MSMNPALPRVLVVGGGLVGLFTAFYLRRAGVDVTVVEQGHVAREASWAGGGILWPLRPWNEPEPTWQLAQRGAELYAALAQQTLGESMQWHRCGMLIHDPETHATGWCRQHEIEFQDRGTGGLFLPTVAQARTPRIGQVIRSLVLDCGVKLREQTTVNAVRLVSGGVEVQTNGHGVETWPSVVLAAGAWAGQLAQSAGVQVPIKPVRGHIALLRTDQFKQPAIVQHANRYLIRRQDGLVLVGSTLEHAGFDRRIDSNQVQALIADAERIDPSLADANLQTSWVGFRPYLRGGQPWVGPLDAHQRLWINAGHYRSGVTMAPASGELLAARMLGHNTAMPDDVMTPSDGAQFESQGSQPSSVLRS